MKRKVRSEGEFVALIALMISLVALSIDAMLPALADIGRDLGVARENERQLVILLLFVGLGLGQMLYGPFSDYVGRKPAIYVGLALFLVGTVLSAFAGSFLMMLIGRFLQGLGAAGPRIVVVAMVRDQYEGPAMARIMSLVMAVFILVPALAPALGQGILLVSHWRVIFFLLLAIAMIAGLWFILRQPETLTRDKRAAFSFSRLGNGIVEVLRNRIALGYTLAAGLIFGAFLGYLMSAQQVFQELYGLGELFPLHFANLALAIGAASWINSRMVMRFGMAPLCRWALIVLTGLFTGLLLFALAVDPTPSLWVVTGCFLLGFFCIGILFGNLNALAMEPLGHIAGLAAAVIGSLTTIISLAFGALIGGFFIDNVIPLVGGFTGLGLASLIVQQWTESGLHRPAISSEVASIRPSQ